MTSPLVDLESKTVDVKWCEWVTIEVPDGESQLGVSYYGGGGFTMSKAKISLDLQPDEVIFLEYRCSLVWLRKGRLRRVPDRASA